MSKDLPFVPFRVIFGHRSNFAAECWYPNRCMVQRPTRCLERGFRSLDLDNIMSWIDIAGMLFPNERNGGILGMFDFLFQARDDHLAVLNNFADAGVVFWYKFYNAATSVHF